MGLQQELSSTDIKINDDSTVCPQMCHHFEKCTHAVYSFSPYCIAGGKKGEAEDMSCLCINFGNVLMLQ